MIQFENEHIKNILLASTDHACFVKHDCTYDEAITFVKTIGQPKYGESDDRGTRWFSSENRGLELVAFIRRESE